MSMAQKIRLTIFFLIILYSQSYGQQKNNAVNNCDSAITVTSRIKWNGEYHSWPNMTFSEKTLIYCNPDTNSSIVDTFLIATRIRSQELIKNQNIRWYRIILKNKKDGYIKEENLTNQKFEYHEKKYGFLIGKKTEHEKQKQTITFRRYELNTHKILESFDTENLSNDYSIEQIHWTTLKGTPSGYNDSTRIFFCYRTARTSCPGSTTYEFLMDTGEELKRVASGFYMGEGNYSNKSTVYIPIRFGNGKIMLVENGDIQHIFNFQTADLNIFPYSEKIGIPITDLIVIKNEERIDLVDDNDNPIINPDGSYKAKITRSIEYYRWDGQRLLRK
jgi:hypothetical protein